MKGPTSSQMKKLLILVVGILLVACPHFPASQVSEQNNNDAFLALTVIGALVMVYVLMYASPTLMKKMPAMLKIKD